MLENMTSVPMVVTSHAQMSLLYLRRDRYPRDPEVERVRWIWVLVRLVPSFGLKSGQ